MIGTFTSTPEFNLHRQKVTAVDASVPTQQSAGVNAKGFRWAVIEVVLKSGTLTNLNLQVMFWSAAAGAFIPCTNTDLQVTGLSGSIRWTVPVMGGIFWVKVDAIAGTGPELEFHVAGYGEPSAF